MRRKTRAVGIGAAMSAYPFILVSITMSPWFNLYGNALSDLENMITNGPVG